MAGSKIIDQFTSTDIILASSFSPKFTPSNVALFSHEASLKPILDDYKQFQNFTDIEKYFSPSTTTYKQAKILFQNPNRNIGSAGGSLFVFPIEDTTATRQTITTPDLTTNISNFQSITDGEFEIVIDGGTPIPYSNINFARVGIQTAEHLKDFLSAIILETPVTLIGGDQIQFTNPSFGAISSIVIQPLTGGSGTDITGATFLNIAGATIVAGTNSTVASFKEKILNIAGLQNDLATVPVITTLQLINTDIEEIATYVETFVDPSPSGVNLAKEKILFFYTVDTRNIGFNDVIDTINTEGYQKTYFFTTPSIDAQSLHNLTALVLANQLSVDYFQVNGEKYEINGKKIDILGDAVKLPYSSLQQKIFAKYGEILTDKGISNFLSSGSTASFKLATYTRGNLTLSFDQKLFEYNFENKIDNINLDVIFANNNIAMTDIGTQVIQTQYEVVILDTLLANGVIAQYTGADVPFTVVPTSASSALKNFEKSSVKERGYFVYATPINSLSPADKAARTMRFSFLLHTPAGLLKISSTGIAFDK